MGDHLSKECVHKDKYFLHEKCKLPVLKSDTVSHRCERAKPTGAVKCHLCEESVFPNTNAGWKKHLMVDECKGNNRRVIK